MSPTTVSAALSAAIARLGDAGVPDPAVDAELLTAFVLGSGRGGVQAAVVRGDALPPEEAAQVAIKNGWVVRSHLGEYHVNCLAIGEDWSMAVLTRYPSWRGYEYGAQYCQSLASRHLASPREPAPALPRP